MNGAEPSSLDDLELADIDDVEALKTFAAQQTGSAEQPLAAELPDGSGFLLLDGPGTGTHVASTRAGAKHTARIPSREEALDGKLPILLVHRGRHCTTYVPDVFARIHAASKGAVRLAAVVDLPGRSSESNEKALSAVRAAGLRLADPRGYLCTPDLVAAPELGELHLKRAPYLSKGAEDVLQVLNAQRDVGVNLLLTSGRALDPGSPQEALKTVTEEGDEALSLLDPGERLVLNLTLQEVWLTSAQLLNELLAHLLDSEQFQIWYIRVQVSEERRSTEQPTKRTLLEGYKRLSQLAMDEERLLLLPQTGTTGWLQLGFGAGGFGTGGPGSDQTFSRPASGGGGIPPLERYFEPTILHSVESAVHHEISTSATYTPCGCAYCRPLFSSLTWSYEWAAMHQVFHMGLLSARVGNPANIGGRAGEVRRLVRAAVGAANQLPLSGPSEPKHLPIWDQLL